MQSLFMRFLSWKVAALFTVAIGGAVFLVGEGSSPTSTETEKDSGFMSCLWECPGSSPGGVRSARGDVPGTRTDNVNLAFHY